MAKSVALRDYFEKRGYKVDYDRKTGNIRVYDPKTRSSSMALKGSYNLRHGKSYVTPNVVKSIEKELASGKYKYNLPSQKSSSSSSSGTSGKSSSSLSSGTSGKSSSSLSSDTPWKSSSSTYSSSPETEARINALQERLNYLESRNQFLERRLSQLETQNGLLNLQPPQMPAQETPVETVQENVPVEGVEEQQPTPQETDVAPMAGTSGFMLQSGTLPSNPAVTAEGLYDYYKKLTGNKDASVIPQIQSALQGSIPAWMVADPVWRLVLMRGGVNPNQLRLEAIRERLNGEEE